MSTEKNVTKQVRGLDNFQASVLSGLQLLTKYQKPLLGLAVVLVALIAAGYGWKSYSDKQVRQRQEALSKIDATYEDEQKAVDKIREGYNTEITKLMPTPPKPEPGKRPAEPKLTPAAEAKKAELTAKIDALKADHSGSLQAYQDYYAKNKKHAEGWVAGLRAANILAQDRKLKEAEAIVSSILNESKKVQFYQVHAGLIEVGLLEDLGEFDKALGLIDNIASQVDNEMKPQVLLTKGRLQLLKNAKPDAIATFDSLIKDFASAPEADKARSMKAMIN